MYERLLLSAQDIEKLKQVAWLQIPKKFFRHPSTFHIF